MGCLTADGQSGTASRRGCGGAVFVKQGDPGGSGDVQESKHLQRSRGRSAVGGVRWWESGSEGIGL